MAETSTAVMVDDAQESVNFKKYGGKDEVELKRTVSLISAVSIIGGTMIGSGIFISPKGVLEDSGSIGVSLIIWTACGLLGMLASLVYAELGSSVMKSGGEWAYMMEAYGPVNKYVGQLPAFLLSWSGVLVTRPVGVAVMTLAFSKYMLSLFYDACGPPEMVVKSLTIVTILFITAIAVYSSKIVNRLQIITFLVKVLALLAIIIGGFYQLAVGNAKYLSNAFQGEKPSGSRIALAFYKGLWAYDGWNNLNYVTEEIKNPKRNIPIALCVTTPLITIIYILTNIAYFTVLSPQQLLASDAVASDWVILAFPAYKWLNIIVTLSVSLSCLGSANGSLLSTSRMVYAAAKGGHLLNILSMVHVEKTIPSASIILTSFIASVMVIPADIFTLIDFFSIAAWFFYALTMIAFFILRYKQPDRPRPFRCPIIIPIIVLLASVYLIVAPIIDSPNLFYLYAALFVFSGVIFFIPFVIFKLKIPFIDDLTVALQKLMRITPTKYD